MGQWNCVLPEPQGQYRPCGGDGEELAKARCVDGHTLFLKVWLNI